MAKQAKTGFQVATRVQFETTGSETCQKVVTDLGQEEGFVVKILRCLIRK